MTYSTSTPPQLFGQPICGKRLWFYVSADAKATVDGSGYITNGYDLGMRDGDLCFVYDTANKIWSAHTVTVSTTTVDLADGTNIGSSTNTD